MNIRRRHKSIKVIRKVSLDQSRILEDSLENDFLLENNTRSFLQRDKSFLTEVTPSHKSIYKEDGTINKTEVVGPPDIFEKGQRSNAISRSNTFARRFNKSSLKSVQKDHLAVYENKIAQIKAGKTLEKAIETEKKSKMNIDERTEYSKDKHSLKNFRKTSQDWSRISNSIAKGLKRDSSCLLMNSGYDWRKRREAIDYIDRITPVHDKIGNRSWYVTLRSHDKEPLGEEHIPLGSVYSGLYTYAKTTPNYPREIIIKDAETTQKSLEKTDYYQTKLRNSCKRLKKNVIPSAMSLEVQGNNKFKMEKDAAWNVGIPSVDPFMVPPPCPEEVIAVNYQGRFKVM